MAGSMYNRKTGFGQTKTVMTRPMLGINDYNDPLSLYDNVLSDAWDARPNSDGDTISLQTIATNSKYKTMMYNTGEVVDGIGDYFYSGSTKYEHLIIVQMDGELDHDTIIDDLVDLNVTSNTRTIKDISAYNLVHTGTAGITSMCMYYTEAKRYVCFTTQNNKTLLLYDYTNVMVVTLPFYPRKIVSHYNRIFAIDMSNKLWWCKAGDPFSWYGLEEDDDKIVTSTAMLNSTAYTIAAQPDVPRPLEFTITTVVTADALGTLAVVGTDSLGVAQSKTYTPITGKYITPDTWGSITSITAAGHTASGTADNIKIGIAPVTGFVQADAGYWTYEQESYLGNLAVLGNSLFIWAQESIWVFQGYSYDTFSSSKYISGIGISTSYTSDTGVAVSNNTAYFNYDSKIFEFDGSSYPKPINCPIYTNGSISNGIYGGIKLNEGNLIADNNNLYVMGGRQLSLIDTDPETPGSTTIEQHYYYMFDIKRRSWWKRAGLAEENEDLNYLWNPYYFNRPGSSTLWAVAEKWDGAETTWYLRTYMGSTYDTTSYICTKAFANSVSDDSTLTQINILCRRLYSGSTLNVYYSTTTTYDADDWVLLKAFTTSDLDDEYKVVTVYTTGSEICRQHHFRLKLENTSVYQLDIYSIEMRYRKIGRSR